MANDEPPEKSSSKALQLVQDKHGKCGATEVVVKLISHPSKVVKVAAIRLGIAVLEEGNQLTQQRILEVVKETGDGQFIKSCIELMVSSCDEFEKHSVDQVHCVSVRATCGSPRSPQHRNSTPAVDALLFEASVSCLI